MGNFALYVITQVKSSIAIIAKLPQIPKMSVVDLPNQQYYLVLGSTWAASDFPSFSNSSPNKSHPGLHCFQTWEKAIELCKELAKQYKSYLFDYVKVGDILVSEITDDFSMGHFSSDCGK